MGVLAVAAAPLDAAWVLTDVKVRKDIASYVQDARATIENVTYLGGEEQVVFLQIPNPSSFAFALDFRLLRQLLTQMG